jgi:hypothetical protein
MPHALFQFALLPAGIENAVEKILLIERFPGGMPTVWAKPSSRGREKMFLSGSAIC